jgi:DNA-binding MarR family transcriptional regulator
LKVELTRKGLACYQKTKEIKSAKMIMSILSEEERQELISILKKIIDENE